MENLFDHEIGAAGLYSICPFDRIDIYSDVRPPEDPYQSLTRINGGRHPSCSNSINKEVLVDYKRPQAYYRRMSIPGLTVLMEPRYWGRPQTVIRINVDKLQLSPNGIRRIVSQIVPLERTRVAYVECKLDLIGVDRESINKRIYFDGARKVGNYTKPTGEPTNTWYYGSRRSTYQLAVYNKSEQLGITDVDVTRFEIRVRIPKEKRPSLEEFLSGQHPLTRFTRVGIVRQSSLGQIDGRTARRVKRLGVSQSLKQYREEKNSQRATAIMKAITSNAISLEEPWECLLQRWLQSDAREHSLHHNYTHSSTNNYIVLPDNAMFIDEMYYSNDNITIDTSKESCSVLDETSSETYDTTHDLKARNQDSTLRTHQLDAGEPATRDTQQDVAHAS
jgi:hypothetical protein